MANANAEWIILFPEDHSETYQEPNQTIVLCLLIEWEFIFLILFLGSFDFVS